ncbi:MAG TPA: hypothetical protein VFA74_15930 [Terriglobales bacterium]|nr:hypothetical protein [Terriglobales bacterium]
MSKVVTWTAFAMMGIGAGSFLAGFSGGFVPCGPASQPGTYLLFGGIFLAIVGFLTLILGAAWVVVRRWVEQG